MKDKYGIVKTRPLADFLPTLTIAAKNLATEMTNHIVQAEDLQGERTITHEHVQNNKSVRNMLAERGIKPENLPAEEDLKKLERRVHSDAKKLGKTVKILPKSDSDEGC
jgi:DNA-damage-inducible protein D